MDWTSLILGLAGIISTLIASGIGLYFRYKEKNATYRETIYNKQIEYIINCFENINRVQKLINVYQDLINRLPKNQLWEDILSEMNELSTNVNKASAILPTELHVALTEFDQICEEYVEAKENNNLASFDYDRVKSKNLKFALLSREYLGVDSLSEENLKLTTEGNFEDLLEMDNSTWTKFAANLAESIQK